MAPSVSMIIDPGVQGWCRRERELGAVPMLHPFCLRAGHLLPHLPGTSPRGGEHVSGMGQ
jgi:hypothetical protein